MATNYSNFTATKSITVPFPFGFTLTARGDGSKTVIVNINPTIPCTLTVTGSAKIYTDEAGTLNESTTKALTHFGVGSAPSYYVKLTSGTAKMYVNTKRIDELLLQQIATGYENAPKIGGDCTNWITLKTFFVRTRSLFNSSVTKVCGSNLLTLSLDTRYNEGSFTGDISGAINSTRITLIDLPTRLPGASMYITGNITNFVGHPWLELVDDDDIALRITGDLTTVDPVLWYGSGSKYLSGDASAWTYNYYIETLGNFTATTIAGMTTNGYFQPEALITTSTIINQYLADIRANIDVVKGYQASEGSRTFDLTGAVGNAAPTGQGLIDKQWIIDHVGPSGQINHVNTR